MSSTNTNTFTVTNAEYLASKIAADLKQMQMLYGDPSDTLIDVYVQEVVVLLKGGYLSSVDYGYRRNEKWVLALSYAVNPVTGQFIDNNPGRVPPGKDISGTTWWTYLRKNTSFHTLTIEEQQKIEASIQIKRSGAPDPQDGLYGKQDKTYSSGGQQVKRKIIE